MMFPSTLGRTHPRRYARNYTECLLPKSDGVFTSHVLEDKVHSGNANRKIIELCIVRRESISGVLVTLAAADCFYT